MISMDMAPPSTVNQAQPVYEVTEDDKKRQKKICDNWTAYNGELDPPLEKMPGQPDDNVITNRCAQVVNAGVDFLFGKEIEISPEDAAPQAAQDVLNAVWGRKEKRIPLLQKLAMSGAMAGTAFLRIVPEPKGTYRLIIVDPATVSVQTAPQDCETVLLYCIEYSVSENINGKPAAVYYHEEITRVDPDADGDSGDPFADMDATWMIQHWTRVGDRGNWTPAGEPIPWKYKFPPIFDCQNLPNPNSFWGIADITQDVIGLNIALNLVQSDINRKRNMNGSIVYATGTGEQVIDRKPGRIIGLPTLESKIVAVSIPSEMGDAMTFAENLRSDIDERTSVPGVATARLAAMPRGDMSGVAIELCFLPLLKKTEKKQCLYGELILDVSVALLVLNGMSEDIDITLAWQSPLPHDDLPGVQSAVAKQALGISNATLMRELGYDPDEEAALSEEETPPPPVQPQEGAQDTSATGQATQGEPAPVTTPNQTASTSPTAQGQQP